MSLLALSLRTPKRFVALATLPMPAPKAAAGELERTVAAGPRGAMIYCNVAAPR